MTVPDHMFEPCKGKLASPEVSTHEECDLMMFRNEDRQSKPIMEALIQALAPLPAGARQSITFGRGSEFSAWRHLKAGIGAEAWFCDPQAPYQKGIVENTNNRLRKYLPRSTEPTALTNRYLRSICQRLNSTPRKCLGYRTPAEVFEAKLLGIQNRLEKNRSEFALRREFAKHLPLARFAGFAAASSGTVGKGARRRRQQAQRR
ncbi:transposase [Antarctobacter heliothermus]|uniref:Transposase n=1 Tax=Antarctobacter heliothermus TaxID=74033 RepID=A0A222E1D7_9RHOB|nr:transposase [Antarctobacter heliothermus]